MVARQGAVVVEGWELVGGVGVGTGGGTVGVVEWELECGIWVGNEGGASGGVGKVGGTWIVLLVVLVAGGVVTARG